MFGSERGLNTLLEDFVTSLKGGGAFGAALILGLVKKCSPEVFREDAAAAWQYALDTS